MSICVHEIIHSVNYRIGWCAFVVLICSKSEFKLCLTIKSTTSLKCRFTNRSIEAYWPCTLSMPVFLCQSRIVTFANLLPLTSSAASSAKLK